MKNLALLSIDDLKEFVSESSIKNEVWNSKQAAEYLQTTVDTVKKLARSKQIPAVKMGDNWRFSSIALYKFVCGEEQCL